MSNNSEWCDKHKRASDREIISAVFFGFVMGIMLMIIVYGVQVVV